MKALTLLLVAACGTSPDPAPTKVFDFSPRSLTAEASMVTSSLKSQLRATINRARPLLARCITRGVLDLTFTLDVDPAGASVEGVAIANPCARDVILALDTSLIAPTAAPERWTVHAPLYTDAP